MADPLPVLKARKPAPKPAPAPLLPGGRAGVAGPGMNRYGSGMGACGEAPPAPAAPADESAEPAPE